jgi:hypothetical protein
MSPLSSSTLAGSWPVGRLSLPVALHVPPRPQQIIGDGGRPACAPSMASGVCTGSGSRRGVPIRPPGGKVSTIRRRCHPLPKPSATGTASPPVPGVPVSRTAPRTSMLTDRGIPVFLWAAFPRGAMLTGAKSPFVRRALFAASQKSIRRGQCVRAACGAMILWPPGGPIATAPCHLMVRPRAASRTGWQKEPGLRNWVHRRMAGASAIAISADARARC